MKRRSMNLKVIRLVNQLMNSNCFIIVDNDSNSCIIIDPASEDSKREIKFIEEHSLKLDYIILTHAHADHCWGANALKGRYQEAKLVYHDDKYQKREILLFFRMWHEDVNYSFDLLPADILIEDNCIINWHDHEIRFVLTPGHSLGSMCIDLEGMLFTGDTIMPFPPYFNGRGSNKEEWASSVKKLGNIYSPETKMYPGHGDVMTLGEWMENENFTRCK